MKNIKVGTITVSYSEGAKDKASLQMKRLSEMNTFYSDFSLRCHVKILNREDWEKDFDLPYGLPFVETDLDIPMVVLPATEDGVIVQATLPFEKLLPKESKDLLASIHYTFKEAVSTFPDLIAFHEIGHIFTEQLGYENLNHWLNEFMATFFAFSFMKVKYPDLSTLWLANGHIRYLDDSKPDYTSMADFDRLYSHMPVANYDWYQKEFAFLADKIYSEFGLDFLTHFKKHLPKRALTTDQAFDYLKEFTSSFEDLKNTSHQKS